MVSMVPAMEERRDRVVPAGALLFLIVILLFATLVPPAAASRDVKVALTDLRPSLFTDDQGKPAGFFVDILNDVAVQEDWNIIWVRGSLSESWGRLSSGEIDLLPGVAGTPERQVLYDFSNESALSVWSQVYARPGSGISTILDLDGKRVASVRGAQSGAGFLDYTKKFSVNVTMVYKDTPAEMFSATAGGEADALVVYNTAALEDARTYGLVATPVMFNPAQFGFAVRKGKNHDLLTILDQYIAEGKASPTSAYSQTMQKWFGIKAGTIIPPWLVGGLVIAAVVAILFVSMSVLLQRQVQKKTAELRQQNEELQAEVTGRKKAEAELIHRNEELHAAYEQLAATEEQLRSRYDELGRSEQALIQARKKLSVLNTLAFQDIQSGIFSLSGFIQLALGAGRPDDAQAILKKGERVLHSLSESLAFARKYQDLGIAQPKWQRVNYVLINAISHLDFSRIHRTVELADLEIYADPLLEDVFVTLMENVLQHGGGATEISIRCRENPDSLTIFIGDNGPGIPEDQKEKIFSREMPRKGGNSLFLAREILSITNITIAESGEPGAGARFGITVPAGGFRFGEPKP